MSSDVETDSDAFEDETEDETCADLISVGVTHASAAAALRRARDAHGLDARAVGGGDDASGERFYDVVKWVNYVRATARDVRAVRADASDADVARACAEGVREGRWRDEAYLTPTLEDDGVLFGFEAYVEGREDDSVEANEDGKQNHADEFDGVDVREAARKLKAENEELRLRLFEVMTTTGMVDEASVAEVFSPVIAPGTESSARSGTPNERADATAAVVKVMTLATRADSARSAAESAEDKLKREVDEGYFDGYSYFDIHRDMIGDVARTDAYRDALEKNPSLIKGKKVLDVGCGTGILSMFAARGGASAVVGVDGAKHIAEVARQNIKHNGFDESGTNQIKIVHGKLEDIAGEIPGAPFDVLVSEWMGYGLLFESMLDTVLVARDRFLKPGGAVLPDIATIHIAGFDRAATDFPFWDAPYGFKMPEISKQLHEGALKSAIVRHVDGERVTTSAAQVCELDLATCSIADTEFTAEFSLTAKEGRASDETHGIVLWFDTEFSKRFCTDHPVMLSTHPASLKTHWVQTMLHFHEPILLGDSSIMGRISMVKSKRPRAYDISLEYRVKAGDALGPQRVALYAL